MNTVKDSTGADTNIYDNNIYYYADEYINSLSNIDELYKMGSNTFTGMIKYIYRHVHFDKSITADINILNDIWDIYTDLVYRYNQKPTIEEYAMLIGVNRETIYTWLNGEYRSSDVCDKLGTTRPNTVKKWQDECKIGRYKGAQAGNVGCIFLCKAVDGMAETAPVQVSEVKQQATLEDIQRRALELSQNKPQLPDNGQ